MSGDGASLYFEVAESEGFEPSDPVTQIGSLANYWFQPLTHDSERGTGYSDAARGLATI